MQEFYKDGEELVSICDVMHAINNFFIEKQVKSEITIKMNSGSYYIKGDLQELGLILNDCIYLKGLRNEGLYKITGIDEKGYRIDPYDEKQRIAYMGEETNIYTIGIVNIPRTLVSLVHKINEFCQTNDRGASSISNDGYSVSYTKESWQDHFKGHLAPYRKLKTL